MVSRWIKSITTAWYASAAAAVWENLKRIRGVSFQTDQAVIEKQSKDYPLEVCAVSGQKLGSMGKPVDMIIGNRLVKLCCADVKVH